jgi:prepilin-type N-terminal cleavage/methylation domain-containing protein
MKLKSNNEGFSLVEMLVSVALLSVVMIGAFAILAAMSKSFANSQNEVQLQDSVQNTYSIVSDIIKESQTGSNLGIQSVQYDSTGNKAYIIDDDTDDWTKSKFYIIELDTDTDTLYLYSDSLYKTVAASATGDSGDDTSDSTDDASDDATATLTSTTETTSVKGSIANYSSIKVKELSNKDSYLLSNNVKTFNVDVSHYKEGYVVVGLELENGKRTASITQNVYLRNVGNTTVASGSSGTTDTTTDTTETDGYILQEITSITLNKTSFAVGDTPISDNFTLIGKYVNESDSSDTKTAEIKKYTCDKFDSALTSAGKQTFTFTALGDDNTITDVTKELEVNVTNAVLELEYAGLFDLPSNDTISTHAELNTYFKITGKDSLVKKTFLSCKNSAVSRYVCNNEVYSYSCNGDVYTYTCNGEIATYSYKCNGTVTTTTYTCKACGQTVEYNWSGHLCSADNTWYYGGYQETQSTTMCGAVVSVYEDWGGVSACGTSGCKYQYSGGYKSDRIAAGTLIEDKTSSTFCGTQVNIKSDGYVSACGNSECPLKNTAQSISTGLANGTLTRTITKKCGIKVDVTSGGYVNACGNAGCEKQYTSQLISTGLANGTLIKSSAGSCGTVVELVDGDSSKVKGCTNSVCSYYGLTRATTDSTLIETPDLIIKSTGEGMFSIINDSDENDYTNVEVIVYFKNANTGFMNTGSGFLTLNTAASYGQQKASYYTEANEYSDYIKISIPSMPKYDGTNYCTYTFNFNWASTSNLNTSDIVMAVYSTSAVGN